MMNTVSRRQFLRAGVLTGAALVLPWPGNVRRAHAFAQSPALRKWATALRGLGPGGLPVAAPDPDAAPVTGVLHYTLTIGQFTDRLHPDLDDTTLWGYHPTRPLGGGSQPPRHLGGVLVVRKGEPIQVTFRNNLPATPIIPIDPSIPGAAGAANRTSVHLHGGHVPWVSDGGPHAWWAPDGTHGESFINVLNPGAAVNEAEYYYPNDQSARLVWYHDHALGITRTNAYAGIASAFVVRDAFEEGLLDDGLPEFAEDGGYELPLVIQDKIFVPANIQTVDPTWTGPQSPGSLWYAHDYQRRLWRLQGNARGGNPKNPPPSDPSVIPEFFGDTMLANGTVYPDAAVEPRRYRLRILNACNARFLNLQLYVDDGSADGITLAPRTLVPTNAAGPAFLQIGTEGGLLPVPAVVPSNVPFNPVTLAGSLILAPAERADVIVDFGAFAGKKLILYNDAPAPFPMGGPVNDYFPGNPNNPVLSAPGFGPDTRQIVRFTVDGTGETEEPLDIGNTTDLTTGDDPLPIPLGVTALPPGVPVRQLTLNETFDAYGRLIQLLGTNVPLVKGTFGRTYMDPATETPLAGALEIWQIANLTGDTHPIHFHLVNVQILSRQPMKVASYNGVPSYTGPARPPDANEAGWKETVRMNPGEVTTVIMRFDLPSVPFVVPVSPRTGGHEYVWHCHILEHEEHDMMRPLVVG